MKKQIYKNSSGKKITATFYTANVAVVDERGIKSVVGIENFFRKVDLSKLELVKTEEMKI